MSDISLLLGYDATHRKNWGARSASIALHQMMLDHFEDVRHLSGYFQTRRHSVGFSLPKKIAEPLINRRNAFRPAQWYVRLETLTGARVDFVEDDPRKTAQNIQKYRGNSDYLDRLCEVVQNSDVVIVDGDGDLIFKETPSRNLLFDLALVELAKTFGKKVGFINSIFADCSETGRNQALVDKCVETLSKCDFITLRDPISCELVKEIAPDLDVSLVPDSLFHWYELVRDSSQYLPVDGNCILPFEEEISEYFDTLDFSVPYICLTGGARAAWYPRESFQSYCRLVARLKTLERAVYLVPTSAGDNFLYEVAKETKVPIVPVRTPILMGAAILAKADLFITGRYHAAILAALGGTPSVFLNSDSHKTKSLQHLLGYDEPMLFPAIPDDRDFEEIVALSDSYIQKGDSMRQTIQQTCEQRANEARSIIGMIKQLAG
jgi:polysaccharide pyruvyl transferase WcaK-like protein